MGEFCQHKTIQEKEVNSTVRQEDKVEPDKVEISNEEKISRQVEVQGQNYVINRANYYNHYYARCNQYSNMEGNEQEMLYVAREYMGSYISISEINGENKSAYWYYPFCERYSCCGNYLYNKPRVGQ